MIEEVISKIKSEAEKFIPNLLGIMIVDAFGFPTAYSLSTAFEDPLVVSGLISSATNMMENLLKELSDSNFELLYTQGEKISVFVGRVGNFYLAFITTPSTKVGTVFMEYKILKPKLENLLKEMEVV